MNESVDRLTFWRNWFDGVDSFQDDMRLAWYDAVMRFAFLGQEPDRPSPDHPLSAIAWNAVQMVRATLQKSRAQRQNGSQAKAKRKPTRSQAEAKRKPNGSQPEANPKQEQEQDKEQEQEQYANSITATTGKLSVNQFLSMAATAGVSADFARQMYGELESVGWTDGKGRRIGATARYLKTAWEAEQKKIRAARVSAENNGPLGNGIQIAR